MFKSILVILLVATALWLSRLVMQRTRQRPFTKKSISKDTVQCLQCHTYIPQEEAIIKDNNAFCCQQHLNDWNQSA